MDRREREVEVDLRSGKGRGERRREVDGAKVYIYIIYTKIIRFPTFLFCSLL